MWELHPEVGATPGPLGPNPPARWSEPQARSPMPARWPQPAHLSNQTQLLQELFLPTNSCGNTDKSAKEKRSYLWIFHRRRIFLDLASQF